MQGHALLADTVSSLSLDVKLTGQRRCCGVTAAQGKPLLRCRARCGAVGKHCACSGLHYPPPADVGVCTGAADQLPGGSTCHVLHCRTFAYQRAASGCAGCEARPRLMVMLTPMTAPVAQQR